MRAPEAPAGHKFTPREGAIDTPLRLTTDVEAILAAAGAFAADTASEFAAADTGALTGPAGVGRADDPVHEGPLSRDCCHRCSACRR